MEIDLLRIDKDKRENIKDIVTDEIPLTIYLNDEELITLLCSPDNLKELSVGFFFSSGLIKSIDDVESVVIDKERFSSYVALKNKEISSEFTFKRLYTPGCGKGVIFYNALDLMNKEVISNDLKVSNQQIRELMKAFDKASASFKETGGVHSAGFADAKDIVVFKEDIGRHNAIDKIIGEALLKGLDIKNMIVLTSGRISSEIINKVAKIKSPILASRSAPTDQGVKLAENMHLTLIGFVRGDRMNVYTAAERII
ncbi:MAG: formate dehydrogenase accessory sulfurtransferase FdhD [Candidatus Omnitrophota bacterium]